MAKFLVTLIHEETFEIKRIVIIADDENAADERVAYDFPLAKEFFINSIDFISEE